MHQLKLKYKKSLPLSHSCMVSCDRRKKNILIDVILTISIMFMLCAHIIIAPKLSFLHASSSDKKRNHNFQSDHKCMDFKHSGFPTCIKGTLYCVVYIFGQPDVRYAIITNEEYAYFDTVDGTRPLYIDRFEMIDINKGKHNYQPLACIVNIVNCIRTVKYSLSTVHVHMILHYVSHACLGEYVNFCVQPYCKRQN